MSYSEDAWRAYVAAYDIDVPQERIEQEYQLVTTVRQDALKNRISNQSPFGKAVQGKQVGDRLYIQVNDSYGYYIIIRAIRKGTDDASIPINSF